MNVLFTGFEPFGEHAYNPSWDVACAAAQAIDATAELLAVTFEAAQEVATRSLHYDLVVHIGVAAYRQEICFERFAHNWFAHTEDSAPERIVVDGPAALECALALDALAATLGARVSHDAGTYVCNATLYHALIARGRDGAMFVHIPMVTPDEARDIGRRIAASLRSSTFSRR